MIDKILKIIIHGGAGAREDVSASPMKITAMRAAISAGWKVLVDGGPGEEAVVAALCVMEECEYFNAGYGSHLNENGKPYMDVGLMKGSGEFLSIMNLHQVKFPSVLALRKLNSKKSALLAFNPQLLQEIEASSEEFKQAIGFTAHTEDLIAPYAKLLFEKSKSPESNSARTPQHGTVGCVVRDAGGKLFAGTSTGGIMNKLHGRVGDSPIPGAGVFADNEICALSATGSGEAILRSCLSGMIIAQVRAALRVDSQTFVKDPQRLKVVLLAELAEMSRKVPGGSAGIIIIPARGEAVFAHNSAVMSVAYRSGTAAQLEIDAAFIDRESELGAPRPAAGGKLVKPS